MKHALHVVLCCTLSPVSADTCPDKEAVEMKAESDSPETAAVLYLQRCTCTLQNSFCSTVFAVVYTEQYIT